MSIGEDIRLLAPLGTWLVIAIIAGWLGLIYLLCTARIRR